VICPHCGERLDERGEHCPFCGRLLPIMDTLRGGYDSAGDDSEQVPDDLRATIVDTRPRVEVDFDPPLDGQDQPADLRDTIIDDRPPIHVAPQQGLRPSITFSEIRPDHGPMEEQLTGAVPLDSDAFRAAGSWPPPRAPAPEPESEPEIVLRMPLPREKAGALTATLALLATLAWLGLAAAMVLSYLGVQPVTRLLARLPVYTEALAAVPGLFTILALLLYALSPAGGGGVFLWAILAALPGIGPALGAVGAVKHFGRCASVGVMLLVYTLVAQALEAWVALTHLGLARYLGLKL